MPDVTTLLTRSYFGVCRPSATASTLIVDGLCVKEDTLQTVPAVLELTQVALNTGSAGKLFEHVFELRIPYAISLAARLRVKLRSVINLPAAAAGAAADCTIRWTVMVSKKTVAGANTALTTPPVEAQGPVHNAGNGTVNNEYEDDNLTIDIPANALAAGETLRIALACYVVQPIAGIVLAVGLRCNPIVPQDSIVFEWDV